MQLHSIITTAAFVAATATANSCNPIKTTCLPVPALASTIADKFQLQSEYFDEVNSQGLTYSKDGLKCEIAKRFDNPSIKSNFYIMFGKVEVVLKAAKGQGIVSSFYLQSDDLDEIDIELIGGDVNEFQSNWFSKGDTTTYNRGEFHGTSSSIVDNYHTYTIEYTQNFVSWSLDGNVVRTLKPDNGQGFPSSPMYIMAGVWAGGDLSNEIGTIEWAGGETDYSQAPFDMHIQSVIVADYSTGSQYSYTDTSGDWTSIKSVGGSINGRQEIAREEFEQLQNGEDIVVSSSAERIDNSSTGMSSEISTGEDVTLLSSSPSHTESAVSAKTSTSVSSLSPLAASPQSLLTISGASQKSAKVSTPISSSTHSLFESRPSQFTWFNAKSTETVSATSTRQATSSSSQLTSLSSTENPSLVPQLSNDGAQFSLNQYIALLALVSFV